MLRDFVSYLKAVFTEGHLPIFTMFTVLGITLFMFPQLAERFIQNEQVVRNIGVGIFLLSFISAHFSLYRKAAIESLPRMSDHLFHLIGKKDTYDGKVVIIINFRGSKSKRSETITRSFDLKN